MDTKKIGMAAVLAGLLVLGGCGDNGDHPKGDASKSDASKSESSKSEHPK